MNMSQSARFVTQSSMWDVPFTGPLTDAKIVKYMREGRYGEDMKVLAHKHLHKKALAKKVKRERQSKREALFEGLFV